MIQKKDQTIMKKCTLCLIIKPFQDFSKASREKDGLQHRCKQCNASTSKKYRTENVEKEKLRHAKYHVENKEKINLRVSEWQRNNLEKMSIKRKRFYKNNSEKEKKRTIEYRNSNRQKWLDYNKKFRQQNKEYFKNYEKEYLKTNRHKRYAANTKRRAVKKQAFPSWANPEKIKQIYAESIRRTKETGILHHVDHIIPLSHDLVCGLHWEGNLQILTASENLSKNNKFKPD